MASTINALTSGGGVAITGDTSGNLAIQTNNGTTAVFVDTSQNVGINTTSPAYKVDIAGTIRGRSDAYLGFVNGSQAGVWWSQLNYAVPAFQGLTSAGGVGNIVFQPGGGNFGIGTTSPSVSFEAAGQSKIYQGSVTTSATLSVGNNVTGDTRPLYIENSSTSSTSNGMIYLNNYNSSFSGVFIQCFSGNNGSQKAFINGAGTYGSATNTYGGTSDARIKTNIVDATPKLNDLMKVRVVNYNRTDQDNAPKELGVIAQELEQIFPTMVFEQEVKDANNNVLCPDRKNVKYSIFVPMLIKAIQEQQTLITTLQNQVAALQAAEVAAQQAQATAKASALTKLAALGLTQDEVKALF
jgi:Chaperone of endosialidase